MMPPRPPESNEYDATLTRQTRSEVFKTKEHSSSLHA